MLYILFSYITSPIIILAFSAVIPLTFFIVKYKKSDKKKIIIISALLLAAFLLINSLACLFLSKRPAIVCPDEFSEYMTSGRKEQIRADITGLYDNSGLLFPGIIVVKYADESSIYVYVQYLFYGTVEFSIDSQQTKSIEKQLY